MRTRAYVIGTAILAIVGSGTAQEFHPDIPKAWDDKAVADFEMPLAQRDRSPRYMSADEYYKLKVRPIYRSYPMYAPGQEPEGYVESLRQKEPEIIFDPSKLHTKEDWIAAGKLVFESETLFRPAPAAVPTVSPSLPISSDGVLPSFFGYRYILRKKGILEVGITSCAGCHTRVMSDGSLFEGGQGVVAPPASTAELSAIRERTPEAFQRSVENAWAFFGAPWIMSKEEFQKSLTKDEYIREAAARRPGVEARQGTSGSHPPHIPSLVGIQDIRYLDATGLSLKRSIGDIMRYAIVNQGLDFLAHFGDFQPTAGSGAETRYSDEQLYALVLYLYSLKPPPNPNSVDDRARRGERIFQQQGCAGCHTPPLYTNNKLTPAQGFKVPDDLLKTGDILNVSVGTDPTLALQTRRGTGFYKIPSLRGVWYRNAFGHGGGAETLEEWFDPERLKDDYVPKGFHLGPGPIKGHEFGLKLAPDDKQALIAFLKTL
jgi:mono/diheme cytochrome c family protein